MNKNLIYRVLLVDDDKTTFDLLSPRLAREGIMILWANTGAKALKIAQEKSPDIVVTDLVMPEMNGFDLIRELREGQKTAHLEYVVLSNYGETRVVYDSAFLNSLGIRKYLLKSNHTPTEITKEIKKAIILCKRNPLKR